VDKRTRARELAMQSLYQFDVQGDTLTRSIDAFIWENEMDRDICQLALDWCRSCWQHHDGCDELISASTKKWSLSRLSIVDKSILRLAVYQLKFCHDIPPKVVINEAIELAKKFSGEKSPAFVNGVLDAVLRKITVEKIETSG